MNYINNKYLIYLTYYSASIYKKISLLFSNNEREYQRSEAPHGGAHTKADCFFLSKILQTVEHYFAAASNRRWHENLTHEWTHLPECRIIIVFLTIY